MPIADQLGDQLFADCKSPEDLMGEQGLLRHLTKKLAERALEAEMEHHLGYAKHDPAAKKSGNSLNSKTSKTVRSVHGEIELEVPLDRNSTFEPRLVKKAKNSWAVLTNASFRCTPAACRPVIFRRILKKPMMSKCHQPSFLR
jgi:transposase-like protein